MVFSVLYLNRELNNIIVLYDRFKLPVAKIRKTGVKNNLHRIYQSLRRNPGSVA